MASQQLFTFGTGLFPPAASPTQKTVVTILVFHGNRVMLAREVVGTNTCGSTLRSACSRNFIAYFAKSAALSYGPIDWPCAAKAPAVQKRKTAIDLVIEATSGFLLCDKCPKGKCFLMGRRSSKSLTATVT